MLHMWYLDLNRWANIARHYLKFVCVRYGRIGARVRSSLARVGRGWRSWSRNAGEIVTLDLGSGSGLVTSHTQTHGCWPRLVLSQRSQTKSSYSIDQLIVALHRREVGGGGFKCHVISLVAGQACHPTPALPVTTCHCCCQPAMCGLVIMVAMTHRIRKSK